MKIPERFYNIGIVLLVLCIIAVVIFKFILPGKPQPQDSFQVKNIEKISVTDLDGNEIKLSTFLLKDGSSYFLLFRLNDCFSCIYRGLEEIANLKKNGRHCFGLVIDDNYKDVDIWAAHYEFSPFLVLKRADFFDYFKSAVTPVVVKFENGKVESFMYIKPN